MLLFLMIHQQMVVNVRAIFVKLVDGENHVIGHINMEPAVGELVMVHIIKLP